jgi:glycosyltransferase involved in cell wall biosynthesis
MLSHMRRRISIITPVFNEEENVDACVESCRDVITSQLPEYEYEHIFADNASTDGTLARLRALATSDTRIKVIANSRNVGVFRNAANAMTSASGDAVVPIFSADLQDPAEVIPDFVRLWEEGNLIVYGIRRNRNEKLLLRGMRGLYYKLLSSFGAERGAPAHAGEFQLLDQRVVKSILGVDDHYPYIRGLVAQTGAKSAVVEYAWQRRRKGKSKIGLWELVDQGVNGFVVTARAPLRMVLVLGVVASVLGVLFGFVSLIVLLVSRGDIDPGIPSVLVGVFFLGGLQLFVIGLVGEFVLSIHGQVRPPPKMFELERINFQSD